MCSESLCIQQRNQKLEAAQLRCPLRSRWIVFFFALSLNVTSVAQLKQIDPAKLPRDQRAQSAYASAQKVEFMAHSWSPSWHYDTPKEEVASLLALSLHELQSTELASQDNEDLA